VLLDGTPKTEASLRPTKSRLQTVTDRCSRPDDVGENFGSSNRPCL